MSKRGRRQFIGKTGRSAVMSNSSFKPNNPKASHPYGEDWPKISVQIKQRDNWSCRAADIGLPPCTNRFPPPFHHLLEAHHLYSYAIHKRHNKKYIITLCADCHQKTHGRVWRNKITDKQKIASTYMR